MNTGSLLCLDPLQRNSLLMSPVVVPEYCAWTTRFQNGEQEANMVFFDGVLKIACTALHMANEDVDVYSGKRGSLRIMIAEGAQRELSAPPDNEGTCRPGGGADATRFARVPRKPAGPAPAVATIASGKPARTCFGKRQAHPASVAIVTLPPSSDE
jgi:hypothetical protein